MLANTTVRSLGWLGVIAATLVAATAVAHEGPGGKKPARVPLPATTIHKGDKCVEPEEVMRRDHMQFILHQRDRTMHEGIRTTKYSLKECINCHADPQTNSVLGQDGFCQSCHSYAAVRIDCFECHSDKAEPKAAASSGSNGHDLATAVRAAPPALAPTPTTGTSP